MANTNPLKLHYNWYKNDFPFELGNEYALLSFYDYILPRLEINPSLFSYHFVPAYTRRVTHFECVELLLKHFPTANVILINGLGTDLFRFNSTRGKTVNVNSVKKLAGYASVEEKKKLNFNRSQS